MPMQLPLFEELANFNAEVDENGVLIQHHQAICPSCGETIDFTTIESPAKPNFSKIRLRQGFSLELTEIDLSVSAYRLDLVIDTLKKQGLRGASPTKIYSAIFTPIKGLPKNKITRVNASCQQVSLILNKLEIVALVNAY